MKNLVQKTVMTTSLFGLSSLAIAHPGHALSPLAPTSNLMSAFSTGMMHPVTGLDHVVLAVGMGMLFASHKKVGLGLLITSLLLGFMLVQLFSLAINPSMIETAILASVLSTAVAILAQRTRFALTFQKGFTLLIGMGLFGLTLFHGMAHAVEMPIGSVSAAFAIGMITTMSALFIMGVSTMNWVKARSKDQYANQWLAWLPSVLASLGAIIVWFNA